MGGGHNSGNGGSSAFKEVIINKNNIELDPNTGKLTSNKIIDKKEVNKIKICYNNGGGSSASS